MQSVSAPEIHYSDGTALVGLARSAMNVYLAQRTAADKQPVPAELSHLERWSYAVSVTLRQQGQPVAQAIRGGGNVCRNVIAAALDALRSPQLPDRVTKELLDSLTVDLEILGPMQPLEMSEDDPVKAAAAVNGAVVPGLVGLKLSKSGEADVYVLPSTAYLQDLTAYQMRQKALVEFPMTNRNALLPWRWSVYLTRQFVGYSDGVVVWIYRGKILLPYPALDEAKLLQGAGWIGAYLRRSQAADGVYTVGGVGASLRDHLYATFAMAQLARQSGDKEIAQSVQAALRYAASRVQRSGPFVFVQTSEPQDQLAATALLTLATAHAAQGESAGLHRNLVATLLSAIQKDGTIHDRFDAPDLAQEAFVTDVAVACLTLAGEELDEAQSAKLKAARARLAGLSPVTPLGALWKLRAVGGEASPLLEKVVPVSVGGPQDELGGFSVGGNSPQTELTALAAKVVSEGRGWPQLGVPSDSAEAGRQIQTILFNARCFCYTQMFHPREAYFAKSPAAWEGAVRAVPCSARVTVSACAAAIEALLAQPASTPE